MKPHPRPATAAFILLAICLPVCQAQLTFEVASVKPNTSMGQNMSINRTPGAGLSVVNSTLRMLITFAYDTSDHQLSGGPAWLDTERYDISAKAPADAKRPDPANFFDDPATGEIRLRLQALLADRFRLAVRHETREAPIFALVVDKGGPKLEPWKEGDGPGPHMHGESRKLTCRRYTMQRFASAILSERLGRTVIDKTGIEGEFNFIMTFEPDPAPSRSPGAAVDAATGPNFLEALREQLGLKLESRRGAVEMLIIDHVEKASAN